MLLGEFKGIDMKESESVGECSPHMFMIINQLKRNEEQLEDVIKNITKLYKTIRGMLTQKQEYNINYSI